MQKQELSIVNSGSEHNKKANFCLNTKDRLMMNETKLKFLIHHKANALKIIERTTTQDEIIYEYEYLGHAKTLIKIRL